MVSNVSEMNGFATFMENKFRENLAKRGITKIIWKLNNRNMDLAYKLGYYKRGERHNELMFADAWENLLSKSEFKDGETMVEFKMSGTEDFKNRNIIAKRE